MSSFFNSSYHNKIKVLEYCPELPRFGKLNLHHVHDDFIAEVGGWRAACCATNKMGQQL